MSQVMYDIEFSERRSRLKTFFRAVLVVPHMIVMQAWQYLVQVITIFQWFVILFTGRRNDSIWNLQNAWLGYAARVWSYYSLMFDHWPNIRSEPKGEPTTYTFGYRAEANRLSNFFRIIWLIPSLVVGIVVIFAATISTVLAWIAIIVTGRHPRALFDYVARTHRFVVRVQSCALLMSDVRPKFGA